MARRVICEGASLHEAARALVDDLNEVSDYWQEQKNDSSVQSRSKKTKTSDFAKEISSRYKGPEKSRSDHNSDITSGVLGKKR